jgi:hypothetical protein
MPPLIVWFFLLFATLFTSVHRAAVTASLYWYYSWFDMVMHFWGGLLVSLGVIALSTLQIFPFKPNPKVIALILLFVMVMWEVFEFYAGLYESSWQQVFDTLKDLLFGSLGAISGYFILVKRKQT